MNSYTMDEVNFLGRTMTMKKFETIKDQHKRQIQVNLRNEFYSAAKVPPYVVVQREGVLGDILIFREVDKDGKETFFEYNNGC